MVAGQPYSFRPAATDRDGTTLYVAGSGQLDAYDLAHPLPVPPVLPTQVRYDPDTGASFTVLTVQGEWTVIAVVAVDSVPVGTGPALSLHHTSEVARLPLVWGPFAPWAPAGWRP